MDFSDKHHHHRASAPAAAARAVALIDARYLRWIARMDEPDEASGGAAELQRDRLNEWLSQALGRSAGRVSLLRSYWYADSDDQAVVNDQTLRLLPSADADGSALVRQLSADAQALVASGRVDLLLIASDDDRLLPLIDAVKLAGVTVCVLADERAQAMNRLMQQDPNWAHLLREADRRVIVRSADLAQALRPGSARSGDAPQGAELEQALDAVVQAWWSELTDDDKDGLREELPGVRGLPPEVDRDLLLRGKNAMGRALNFHEKRALRSHARNVALGTTEPLPEDTAPQE